MHIIVFDGLLSVKWGDHYYFNGFISAKWGNYYYYFNGFISVKWGRLLLFQWIYKCQMGRLFLYAK